MIHRVSLILCLFLVLGCFPLGKATEYSVCDTELEQCAEACAQVCADERQCPPCLLSCSTTYEKCTT